MRGDYGLWNATPDLFKYINKTKKTLKKAKLELDSFLHCAAAEVGDEQDEEKNPKEVRREL